ncbi:hypothetical protein X777_05395 [Ooceraea biroi]|uniref:Uncharacterized protein n=1 Tax=Ooceraea biroi TaxID=2015173 RepID=A0A026WFR3_OOCBI|nr:hypothetical protein X777_05395 [Ooceraea biroi]
MGHSQFGETISASLRAVLFRVTFRMCFNVDVSRKKHKRAYLRLFFAIWLLPERKEGSNFCCGPASETPLVFPVRVFTSSSFARGQQRRQRRRDVCNFAASLPRGARWTNNSLV